MGVVVVAVELGDFRLRRVGPILAQVLIPTVKDWLALTRYGDVHRHCFVPTSRLIDHVSASGHRAGVDRQVAQKLDLRGNNLLSQHDKQGDLVQRRGVVTLQIRLDVLDQTVIGHNTCGRHAFTS